MTSKSPKFADQFLGWFIKGDLLEEILGDLHEYHEELRNLPKWKRKLKYWYHALHFLRPNLTKSFFGNQRLNYLGMIKLNLRVAIRSLLKNKVITIPSLLTLIFGTLCFHLIHSWLDNESRMDEFHGKFDRIYMGAVQTNPMADFSPISPRMIFQLDYEQFPEIEKQLSIHIYENDEIKVSTDGREFGGKALIADSTFFSFFDFPIRKGTLAGLLDDPSHIVLSGNFGNRIFGNVTPIGKMIEVSCDQKGLYKVAAVTENIPANSSIDFDFIIPRHSKQFWRRIPMDLVLAREDFDVLEFNETVAEMGRSNQRFPESIISFIPISASYFYHPLDVSLFGKFGNKNTVRTLAFIGMMICLITFLGFNNLQSIRQLSAANKIGIRQLIGGSKLALCVEMIVERLLYLLVATVLTYLLYAVIFPYYQSVLSLSLNHRPFFDFLSILSTIGAIVSISILISAFHIFRIDVKESVIGSKNLFKIPRMQRSVTTIQYAVTIVLLIVTVVVLIQYRYMSFKNPGFKYQNIVEVDFFEISSEPEQEKSFEYIKNQLTANPKIAAFSQGDLPVNSESFLSSWKKKGKASDYESHKMMNVSPEYLDLLGIDLLQGRFFSDSLDNSGQQKIVINEAARKYWEIDDISKVRLSSNTSGRSELEFEIIGVVDDFHFEHLSKKIQPLVLRYRTYNDDSFLVRFIEEESQAGMSFLEKLFKEVNPNSSFDYDLLNYKIALQYEDEKQLSKVYSAFTIIALILSSISLFTFSLYETRRRTKEIGIRKVNGASSLNIFRLLSLSFLSTIGLAFIIGVPFAWYFSSQWIQEFAYRANIEWWVFVLSGIVISIFALLAILWHVRAIAVQNPIESLRYE